MVLLRPKKGAISGVRLAKSAPPHRSIRILSHDEQIAVSTSIIFFLMMTVFRDVLDDMKDSPDRANLVGPLTATLQSLLDIPRASPEDAKRIMEEQFDAGTLRCVGKDIVDAGKADRLFRLCLELTDRYYVVAEFEGSKNVKRQTIRYSYREQIQERSFGRLHHVRALFRAPSSAFRIHIPLARVCDHYEFRMEPLPGYYVYEQRIVEGDGTGTGKSAHAPVERAGERFWKRLKESPLRNTVQEPLTVWSENGRTVSPHVFVGNGPASSKRLYVGVRFFEVPPGATGTALLSSVFAAITAVGLVMWQMAQPGSTVVSASGSLLCGLVGVGVSAVDRTLPRDDILNAPFAPRVLMFGQSLGLLCLAIWLLAYNSKLQSTGPWSNAVIRSLNDFGHLAGGPLIVFSMVGSCLYLATRLVKMVRAYDSRITEPLWPSGLRNTAAH